MTLLKFLCLILSISCVLIWTVDADEHPVHPENPAIYIVQEFDVDGDGQLNLEEFEAYFVKMFGSSEHNDPDEHDEHDEHDDPDEHDEHDEHDDPDEHDEHEKRDFDELCPSVNEIFVERDVNQDGFLSVNEAQVATQDLVSLVLQGCIDSGDDHHDDHDDDHGDDCEPPTSAEKWGYGTLAVVVISLFSVVGLVLVPIGNPRVRERIVFALIAFAVGALLGDALLHIIPEAFGIHNHGGHSDEHGDEYNEDEEEEEDRDFLWKGVVVFAGVFMFFLINQWCRYISAVARRSGAAVKNGCCSHDCETGFEMTEVSHTAGIEQQTPAPAAVAVAAPDHYDKVESDDDEDDDDKNVLVPAKPVDSWRDIKPVGWLNLSSDFLCNFVDGLGIGAAFSTSLSTGLATSIAVAMHELPLEFADFGILVHSGFSKRWALALNLLCSTGAYAGLYIGLGIGAAVQDAATWLLALTAGGFLYISLCVMLPILLRGSLCWRRLLGAAFMMNAGFWILFIIGWYEGDLGGCGH